MRTRILALVAAAALVQAPTVFAQVQTPSEMQAPLPQAVGAGRPADYFPRDETSYDFKVMMLKKKMERLTREDGGQLTPEHQASLQAELDKLNRSSRPRIANR